MNFIEKKMDKFEKKVKIELYNDHFENAKRYQIPRAQLIIADIPYNIGINAYGSRSDWYVGGDNKNGESDKAGKEFFDTDKDFKIYNFFQFCTRLLKKEPKERGQAPCMIIFCSWQQLNEIKDYAKQFGFNRILCICDEDNYASEKVILKNGGILENDLYFPKENVVVKRYWIEL